MIGALLPPTIERAARIGDGFVTVAHPQNWAEIRGQVSWYRDAGGTGTIVRNTIQPFAGANISASAFTDAVMTDAERARTAGVDEMHITLNLVGVHPNRQAELLEDLAAELKLIP